MTCFCVFCAFFSGLVLHYFCIVYAFFMFCCVIRTSFSVHHKASAFRLESGTLLGAVVTVVVANVAATDVPPPGVVCGPMMSSERRKA